MNKLIKDNLRESTIIAAIGALMIAATIAVERKQASEQAPVSTIEADTLDAPIVDFVNEIASEEFVAEEPSVSTIVVDEILDADRDVSFSRRDLFCLQQNIYYEARGEKPRDQRAIAWVTLNRVEHPTWPDNVCDVVWQPAQFSWTRHTVEEVPNFKNSIEERAWYLAKEIAQDVMAKFKMRFPDPTSGADHYHADYVSPIWADGTKMTAQAGAHIFYKLR